MKILTDLSTDNNYLPSTVSCNGVNSHHENERNNTTYHVEIFQASGIFQIDSLQI